ncbi:MAG: hypothetical protein LUH55_00740 [Bacteroides thetaiotaomicron]|nr:hypothetical protein [Bacteroides thetaiotaomicron]
MVKNYSEQISSFLSFLRETRISHDISITSERETGEETQDILHSLELGENNYHDCAKLSIALRNVRRERRIAKDNRIVTGIIVDWADKNQRTINSLEQLLGEVRKAEKGTENRYYNQKTDIVTNTLKSIRKGDKSEESIRSNHGLFESEGNVPERTGDGNGRRCPAAEPAVEAAQ